LWQDIKIGKITSNTLDRVYLFDLAIVARLKKIAALNLEANEGLNK
jgi:hypothetical protein